MTAPSRRASYRSEEQRRGGTAVVEESSGMTFFLTFYSSRRMIALSRLHFSLLRQRWAHLRLQLPGGLPQLLTSGIRGNPIWLNSRFEEVIGSDNRLHRKRCMRTLWPLLFGLGLCISRFRLNCPQKFR